MNLRRLLALLMIVAGACLCGIAALHLVRGFEAQSAARRVFENRQAPPVSPVEPPPVTPTETAEPEAPAGPSHAEVYPLGQPIARLCIPSAKIDLIVFGGSDPDILEKGPGHIPGTELPGRRSGWNNCVITGHRDSHFRNLKSLREGQRIELETPDGDETYRVVSREVVDPSAVRVLRASSTRRLTLITCYPFHFIGPAPQRFVVVAEPEAN